VTFAGDVGQSETETERRDHTRRRHRRQVARKGSAATSSGENEAGRRDDDQRKLTTKPSPDGSRPPLTPSESDRSVNSEGSGLRRRKKKAATWHSAQNPLFK
jgi:hypothetical protein